MGVVGEHRGDELTRFGVVDRGVVLQGVSGVVVEHGDGGPGMPPLLDEYVDEAGDALLRQGRMVDVGAGHHGQDSVGLIADPHARDGSASGEPGDEPGTQRVNGQVTESRPEHRAVGVMGRQHLTGERAEHRLEQGDAHVSRRLVLPVGPVGESPEQLRVGQTEGAGQPRRVVVGIGHVDIQLARFEVGQLGLHAPVARRHRLGVVRRGALGNESQSRRLAVLLEQRLQLGSRVERALGLVDADDDQRRDSVGSDRGRLGERAR